MKCIEWSAVDKEDSGIIPSGCLNAHSLEKRAEIAALRQEFDMVDITSTCSAHPRGGGGAKFKDSIS